MLQLLPQTQRLSKWHGDIGVAPPSKLDFFRAYYLRANKLYIVFYTIHGNICIL